MRVKWNAIFSVDLRMGALHLLMQIFTKDIQYGEVLAKSTDAVIVVPRKILIICHFDKDIQ